MALRKGSDSIIRRSITLSSVAGSYEQGNLSWRCDTHLAVFLARTLFHVVSGSKNYKKGKGVHLHAMKHTAGVGYSSVHSLPWYWMEEGS